MTNVQWNSKRPRPKVENQYGGGFNKCYKIQKGNTAWDIAKSGLISCTGKAPTDKEIMNEITRLAKLNGCKDINEFSKMFKIGTEIRITGSSVEKNTLPNLPPPESIFLPKN